MLLRISTGITVRQSSTASDSLKGTKAKILRILLKTFFHVSNDVNKFLALRYLHSSRGVIAFWRKCFHQGVINYISHRNY